MPNNRESTADTSHPAIQHTQRSLDNFTYFCRFPSTHPDKDLFPGTHAQISDLSADLLTDPVAEGNTRQADTAPTTKADKAATRPGAKPQSAQQQSESAQQQSRSAQQQQLQEAEEEPAAAQASSSQLHDSNWRNALREQLSAASGYLSSGLHSVPKDATAISIGPDQVASGSQSAAAGNPAIDATQTSKGGKHRKKKGSQTEAVPIVPNFAASNFPWDIKMVDKTICNDSCHKAVSYCPLDLLDAMFASAVQLLMR